MLNWLRRRNAPARVTVIESLPVDGKRSVILVRRDNIEHLVMVGGRNDLVIEPNIMRRPAPNPARRPALEWKGLPPAPLVKDLHHNLEKLTTGLKLSCGALHPFGASEPRIQDEIQSRKRSRRTLLRKIRRGEVRMIGDNCNQQRNLRYMPPLRAQTNGCHPRDWLSPRSEDPVRTIEFPENDS
jgi:hypothetical protein